MLRFAALFALVAVAAAEMNEGYTCIRCNQARDTEEKCNNQKGDPGTVDCGPNDVCTTDVRCDGRGRPYYIKGCQPRSSITALDELICNADVGSATRCHWHCEGDLCNEAMPQVAEGLACTDNPPTSLRCTAGFSRDYTGVGPDMTSFSGQTYTFNTQNKFLMAQAFQPDANPCKFQVRCQMDLDNEGNIIVWWCGVAFGIHQANSAKFDKNFRISSKDNTLEVRGREYDIPVEVNHMAFNIPPGSEFEGENNGDGTYTVTGEYPDGGCHIQVDYVEGDPDDMMTLTVSGYEMEDLNGACADSCFGFDPDGDMDDCIDGAHQNPA